jgi:tRNA G18 (ribose-2'-O)-methylase SpoU
MRKLKNSELKRKTISEFKLVKKNPIVIILDNIRSMNNIGSVFRSADAFLIKKIYLCGITAVPPNKDIQKTALGATDSVSWEYSKSTLETVINLKNKGVDVIAVEQIKGSEILNNFQPKKNKSYALIFGNEVKGVSQEVIDFIDNSIEIPQFGTKHSLNISVSVGIVLWDFYSKMKN